MNSFINFSLKDIRNLHAGPERQNCSCERSCDTERRENGWRVVGCELPGSLEDVANVHLAPHVHSDVPRTFRSLCPTLRPLQDHIPCTALDRDILHNGIRGEDRSESALVLPVELWALRLGCSEHRSGTRILLLEEQ